MSMVKDAIFNEESRKRETGTIDSDESLALVSQGSRERDRGQGRGQRGTSRGQPRSQSRSRTFTCFYYD